MSIIVRQVKDPSHELPSNTVHRHGVQLEADGTLDIRKIEFINPNEVYMSLTRQKGSSMVLVHPSTSPILLPAVYDNFLHNIDGRDTLTLISEADWNAHPNSQLRLSQVFSFGTPASSIRRQAITNANFQTGSYAQPTVMAEGRQPQIPTGPSNILARILYHSLYLPPSTEIIVLVRLVRDMDEPAEVVRTWEVPLEADLSLNPYKLDSLERDETYYSHAYDGRLSGLFSVDPKRNESVSASILADFLHEGDEIAIPTLTIISWSDYKAMLQRKRDAERARQTGEANFEAKGSLLSWFTRSSA